jgi:hypothetical protein
MNNKSAKKHKPKPKHKKKTASLQSKKKKEIKSGGELWPFLKKKPVESMNNIELHPLLNSNNPASSVLTNQQSQPEVPPPNAQPQGFNTIKSTSRCSIL